MKMRFRGKNAYEPVAGQIEQPGDFGYRIDLERVVTDGIARDVVKQVCIANWCPKFGVCMTRIHEAKPDRDTATWQWNGNWECPTVVPSIGCENAPRCGLHRTITNGEINP